MSHVKKGGKEKLRPVVTPCLCAELCQAARTVTRIYDTELRETGLRSTQHSVLRLLGRTGEVRQGDLGEMAALDETTLTRSLRPLEKYGWIAMRPGSDRREKMVTITDAGKRKLEQARPAWSRARSGSARASKGRVGVSPRGLAERHEGRRQRAARRDRVNAPTKSTANRLNAAMPFQGMCAPPRSKSWTGGELN